MNVPSRVAVGVFSACLGVCAWASGASASGLYFTDRGVRPMGRAGAFVAGADDLGAVWYNPAGVAEAGTAVLVDFTWVDFELEYQRQLRVVESGGAVEYVKSPVVVGEAPVLPLPTFAASYAINDAWTLAGGMYAPYVALPLYPETVDGEPSPARYALGSFKGSQLALPGVWLGWAPHENLKLGVGVQALIGTVRTTLTFSASPQDRLIGAPEQPEYDAAAALSIGPFVAPSASAGVIYSVTKELRLGLSGQLATHIDAPGTLEIRLPTGAVFDSAEVQGNRVDVALSFAPILRVGAELRPTPSLRVEAAFVREFWSVHETIDVRASEMSIDGVIGMPPSLSMPDIEIPRHFHDALSYRLGLEWSTQVGEYPLDIRAGVMHDEGAVPAGYVSLSSLDFDKTVATVGGSIHLSDQLRLDFLYGRVFGSQATVSADEAKIPRINPLSGNAPLEAINGGEYAASANLIGLGMNYRL